MTKDVHQLTEYVSRNQDKASLLLKKPPDKLYALVCVDTPPPRISAYDAARSLLRSGAGGRYRSTTAAGAWAAAKQRLVAEAVDRRDRQTDGRTDGHRTVTQTLAAYHAGSVSIVYTMYA